MRPLRRSELIELIITAGSQATRWNFPDIPQLRDDTTQDILIRSIRSYSISTMPLAPSGNVVATEVQVKNAFLVLYVQNEESIHWIPLVDLLNTFQQGAGATTFANFEEQQLDNIKVDWNKSYVQLAAPFAGAFAQLSFMFRVGYNKFPPGTFNAIQSQQMTAPATK